MKGVRMSTEEVFERVKKVIIEQLGVTESAVTSEASFLDDLSADSLDIVELVMAVEEEFDTLCVKSAPCVKLSAKPLKNTGTLLCGRVKSTHLYCLCYQLYTICIFLSIFNIFFIFINFIYIKTPT